MKKRQGSQWVGSALVAAIFVCLLSPVAGWTFDLPPQKGLINDFGGFLTSQEVVALDNSAILFAKKFSPSRIIIVTNKDAAENDAKMARRIFNEWKLKNSDILAIFSASGKSAAFRIDPGQAVSSVISDKDIKIIRSSVEPLLAKNRTDEALQLTISSLSKELESARNAKTMLNVIVVIIILSSLAVVSVIFVKRSRRRQRDREEIIDRILSAQKRLTEMGDRVSVHSRKKQMLSAATQGRHEDQLRLISSQMIAQYLTVLDEIKDNIGQETQPELRKRCDALDKEVDKIKKAFELVDRLIKDEGTSKDSSHSERGTPGPEGHQETLPRTESSSVARDAHARPSTTEPLHGQGGHTSTPIIRERSEHVDRGQDIIIVGGLGGHEHDHHLDHEGGRSSISHFGGGESQTAREEGNRRDSHFGIEPKSDDRGGHFSLDSDPVISDPFPAGSGADERGGHFEPASGSDERGGSFSLEASPVIENGGSGTSY